MESQHIIAPPAMLVVNHVLRRGAELVVPLDDLVDGVEHVLLGDALAARADGEHARLGADAAQLGTRSVRAKPRDELVADVAVHAHGLGVDLEDVRAALEVGQPELDLTVEAARAQQRRVERVRAVRRHEHLDVAARIEAVQLSDDLEHRALHLVVRPRLVAARAAPADGVNLGFGFGFGSGLGLGLGLGLGSGLGLRLGLGVGG
mmetsp:Transcript_26420/g.82369  ORF Transcript_26420/g.82369 Transcript_26420/m.82369 type:complete len:205 (+) Transcript_26420:486-1100(+)